jgi:DNA polymerase-3 subunit epsilon
MYVVNVVLHYIDLRFYNMAIRQIILDTETTGLKPEEGHKIIELAAVEMIDYKLTGNNLHLYFNPERVIDAEATKIHGITNEAVADKPKIKEVVNQIIEFVKDSELIIHNAKFDMAFLNHEFNLLQDTNIKEFSAYVSGVIDTLIIARQKFPGAKNSLDALCDRFNVDRSNRDFHGALIDCNLLAQVYCSLIREQTNLLGSNNKKNNNKIEFTRFNTNDLNLIINHATKTEVANHKKYLQQLDKISKGKSLWFNQSHELE